MKVSMNQILTLFIIQGFPKIWAYFRTFEVKRGFYVILRLGANCSNNTQAVGQQKEPSQDLVILT